MEQLTIRDWARFWSKVEIPDEGNALNVQCWNWRKGTREGYGRFRVGDKKLGAQRIAYQYFNGSIADGMAVCHSCDNPLCCNPEHLWTGTAGDNNRDRAAKGRSARGERHGKAKLSEAQARQALAMSRSGLSQRKVAAFFGVSRGAIQALVEGKNWAFLQDKPSE